MTKNCVKLVAVHKSVLARLRIEPAWEHNDVIEESQRLRDTRSIELGVVNPPCVRRWATETAPRPISSKRADSGGGSGGGNATAAGATAAMVSR